MIFFRFLVSMGGIEIADMHPHTLDQGELTTDLVAVIPTP
jgi:hypothetical protein